MLIGHRQTGKGRLLNKQPAPLAHWALEGVPQFAGAPYC